MSDDAAALVGEWDPVFDAAKDAWAAVALRPPPRWVDAAEEAWDFYERLLASGSWRSGPASVMGVLGRTGLELDHSRMLAWLLDPRGRHGIGTGMIVALRRAAGCRDVAGLEHAEVAREERCYADDGTSGSVDVVVRGPDWSMVIENKVWAGQHGDQLDFYFDAFIDQAPDFLYLTPACRPPDSARDEVVHAWRPVGWRRHVIPALRELLGEADEVGARDAGRNAARDYLHALEEEL